MLKSIKIRLELNNKQKSMCAGHAGVSRHAYNQGLAYCIDSYNSGGTKLPTSIDLHKWLVATVKKDNPWYYNYSKCSPQEALRNLEKAYRTFFKNKKGFPKFKKKGQRDSFYLEGNIQIKDNKIKVPKFGWLKCSEIPPNVSTKNVTISRVSNEWYISFRYEFTYIKTSKKYDSVGVDLGIKTLVTLSNGGSFENSKPYKNAKSKLRKQQKEVSRRFVKNTKNQSNNYKKSVLKLSKTHAKVANARKDYLHKITSYLTKNFDTVVIEDLKVKSMTKNHNLASAILDGGFFEFKRQMLYKKEWYGGSVILANTYFPSSKLCSGCNSKKDVLKLSEREYVCTECGLAIDRDYNASLNLKNLAVSSTVTAFGDKSTGSHKKESQLIDELGIKHQMFTFV